MTSRVIVSIRVKASPERAFQVFTRDIGLWWRANDLFRFTPKSPGPLAFEGGAEGRLVERLSNGKVFEIGPVTAWEPGARLAFGWRQASFAPDQHTEVEVRFEPVEGMEEGETRVTVEHRGWDSVPAAHLARHGLPDGVFLRRHGEWWSRLLAAFRGTLP